MLNSAAASLLNKDGKIKIFGLEIITWEMRLQTYIE